MNPSLARTQIKITPADYAFLRWDSFIGCNDLKTFYAWELRNRITALNFTTIESILHVVVTAETLDDQQKQVILANRPTSE